MREWQARKLNQSSKNNSLVEADVRKPYSRDDEENRSVASLFLKSWKDAQSTQWKPNAV